MSPLSPLTAIARRATRAALVALLVLAQRPDARADDFVDPPGRVARVNLALGAVSVRPAGSESWLADVVNRPLTDGDKLWADRDSRVELHIGSAAVRLGSETGIAILDIDDQTIQLRLSAGTIQLRVRALGPEQRFESATPAASVAVLQPGAFRIEADDAGTWLRVAVTDGQAAVTGAGHEVTVGSGQLADYGADGEGTIRPLPADDAFDAWAAERDRREDQAVAPQYVSREMTGYEDLDDYGSWRTVAEYGAVWVPVVAVGWAPYHHGHWVWVAPWGWTWVDDAPWGFAPSHYGRWVFVSRKWCWVPGPRPQPPIYSPALVGWLGAAAGPAGGGGPPVGWFPLGWNEMYIPAYRASDAYVRNVNAADTHAGRAAINEYLAHRTMLVDGRRTFGADGVAASNYANVAVAGAVAATTLAAFTSAQSVASHRADLALETSVQANADTSAPAIAPTVHSLGRTAAAPHFDPAIWARPVIARSPPPLPPPSFEAQRQAVIANGGLPVPARGIGALPTGAGASPARRTRTDVVQLAATARRTATATPGSRETLEPAAVPAERAHEPARTGQRAAGASRPASVGASSPARASSGTTAAARPRPAFRPPAGSVAPSATRGAPARAEPRAPAEVAQGAAESHPPAAATVRESSQPAAAAHAQPHGDRPAPAAPHAMR